jgi:hypothetical protein
VGLSGHSGVWANNPWLVFVGHKTSWSFNAMTDITEKIARKVLDTIDAGLVSGIGKPIPGEMCVEAAVCFALGQKHGDEPSCVSPAIRCLKIRLNDSRWSSTSARAKGLRRLGLAQLGSKDAIDDKEFNKRIAELVIRKVVPYALWCAAKIQKGDKHKQALLDAAEACEREGTRTSALAAYKIAAAAAAAYADAAAYAADSADAAADSAADAAADAAAYAGAAAAYADAAAYAGAAADSADAAAYADAADAAAYAAAYADAAAYAAADAAAYAGAAADSADAAAYAAAYADAAAYAGDKVLSKFAEEVVQILIKMNAPGCQWLWMTETP